MDKDKMFSLINNFETNLNNSNKMVDNLYRLNEVLENTNSNISTINKDINNIENNFSLIIDNIDMEKLYQFTNMEETISNKFKDESSKLCENILSLKEELMSNYFELSNTNQIILDKMDLSDQVNNLPIDVEQVDSNIITIKEDINEIDNKLYFLLENIENINKYNDISTIDALQSENQGLFELINSVREEITKMPLSNLDDNIFLDNLVSKINSNILDQANIYKENLENINTNIINITKDIDNSLEKFFEIFNGFDGQKINQSGDIDLGIIYALQSEHDKLFELINSIKVDINLNNNFYEDFSSKLDAKIEEKINVSQEKIEKVLSAKIDHKLDYLEKVITSKIDSSFEYISYQIENSNKFNNNDSEIQELNWKLDQVLELLNNKEGVNQNTIQSTILNKVMPKVSETSLEDKYIQLADKYLQDKKYKDALKYYKLALNYNSSYAQYKVGYMLYFGYGGFGKKDTEKAYEYLKLSEENGNSAAAFFLKQNYKDKI
ncbi:MAG: tetratricopeptide repeat protein [Peptostreptococcaceae bacterium]